MKRTAGPRTKPFEFRVGIGMPAFRGMRTVGDASYVPPNQFRYLQNVRLGDGPITNRPGLTARETLGAPAVWITEVEAASQAATIYVGPAVEMSMVNRAAATDSWMSFAYARLDFSRVSPDLGPIDFFENVDFMSLFFQTPDHDSQTPIENSHISAFSPVGANAYVVSEGGYLPLGTDRWENYPFWNDPAAQKEGLGWWQHSAALDPMVPFLDDEGNLIWLAPGGYRGDRWSVVGDYEPPYYSGSGGSGYVAAAGDPDVGGQPIVEVNFDTESAIDRDGQAGYTEDNPDPYSQPPNVLADAFPGGATEVFRLPPPGYKGGFLGYTINPIPTANWDPTMYPVGNRVRSMVSVSRRADDLRTGAEITRDRLYIGTVGGAVKQIYKQDPGTPSIPDTSLVWGVNDPEDGDVYSFDGTTLVQELTGVGMLVCMAKTPAGGVLAAGAAYAAYLPEPGVSWQTVTYNPVPTVDASGTYYYNQFCWGYYWMSRVVFLGEIYLIGFDIGASFRSTGGLDPASDYRWKLYWADRLVIGKFNPGSLTIDIIRRGTDMDQFLATSGGDVDPRDPSRLLLHTGFGVGSDNYTWDRSGPWNVAPVLATDGPRLYYLTMWGVPYPSPIAYSTYIGMFDGTTWDDDAYPFLKPSQQGPIDMVGVGNTIWLRAYQAFPNYYPLYRRIVNGGAVETFEFDQKGASDSITHETISRMFAGP